MALIGIPEHAINQKEFYSVLSIQKRIEITFGFLSDPDKTTGHNAHLRLAAMPSWYYFVRPTHLSFHDCTTTLPPPKNLRSLLGLGLKFIPTPRLTNYWSRLSDPDNDARTMPRFRRDFSLKHYFTCDPAVTPDDDYNPRLYISRGL